MLSTLAQAKLARIPEALNIYPTDARFLQFVNACCQRLIARGHWWGTTGRFKIAVTSNLLTLPPQIATPEGISLGGDAIPLRDQWYEFHPGGLGLRDEEGLVGINGMDEAMYRGNFCVFSDIVTTGNTKKLNVLCDLASDAGKSVLLLGYDENNNWIRTNQGGTILDGEVVSLAATPGTNSTKNFSRITNVQPPTNLDGQWYLREYDTVLTTYRVIGQYQHWETSPSYPRYLIPYIGTSTPFVYLVGKLEFIPVRYDTDYLSIGNLEAVKLGCMSIKAEEEHQWDEAAAYMNGRRDKNGNIIVPGAIQLLDEELRHYRGDTMQTTIRTPGSGGVEVDPIPALQ